MLKKNRCVVGIIVALILAMVSGWFWVQPLAAERQHSWLWTSSVAMITQYSPDEPLYMSSLSPMCHFGVSGSNGQFSSFDVIANFGIGHYLDFSYANGKLPAMAGAEYVRMIRVTQDRPDDPVDSEGKLLRDAYIPCDGEYDYGFNIPLTDEGLGLWVDQNPGYIWIIGNEPDRRIAQDDVCPQQYAQAYHDAYHFIKSRDPSARIAIAGLVEVTPGRLQYLDIVWDTYLKKYGTTMPVDVWTMHIYILPETGNGNAHIALGTDPEVAIGHSFDCDDPTTYCSAEQDSLEIFAEQVESMRRWMKTHGQQNKPLLLTEFGVNVPYHYPTVENPDGRCYDTVCPADIPDDYYCFCDENSRTFHPDRVADYLQATFNYLLNTKSSELGYPQDDYRLVQQWAWFALETAIPRPAHSSNLIDSEGSGYALTAIGEQYHTFVSDVNPTVNLFPFTVSGRSERALDPTANVTATLQVRVMNNGNLAVNEPVSVTFYSDAALTTPIGAATLDDGISGCALNVSTVDVVWPDLPPGVYNFWVKVDDNQDGGLLVETSESDNVMKGTFIANPHSIFLPLTLRR
jgi:hypothetical protein